MADDRVPSRQQTPEHVHTPRRPPSGVAEALQVAQGFVSCSSVHPLPARALNAQHQLRPALSGGFVTPRGHHHPQDRQAPARPHDPGQNQHQHSQVQCQQQRHLGWQQQPPQHEQGQHQSVLGKHQVPGQQPPPQQHIPPPATASSRYAAMLANDSAFIDVKALRKQSEADTGLMLFMMKRQKRRDVWHFMRLVRMEECWQIERKDLTNEHAKQAYCLLCNTAMPFRVGGSKAPEHMETFHRHELRAYTAQAEQRDRGDGEPVIRNLTSAFNKVACAGSKKRPRPIAPEEQKRVNELLAEWIARHFRPMVIVEDQGFIRFVQFITEDICGIKLNLPERTKVRQEIIALAIEYRRRVRKAIGSGCWFFSVTSDIWTGPNAKSYISVTLHYVDADFNPHSWTLEVQELPGIHDAEAIASAIDQVLERWSLPKENCVKCLRDGGANMVAAGDQLGLDHMSCIAHSLHLVVAGALIKKPRARGGTDEPAWAAEVAAECSGVVVEREEEADLSEEDRRQIDEIRELAISDMEKYLGETIASLERNEMDAVRDIVQRFRTLATYFRKSAKGNSRLGALQVEHFNIKLHEVKSPIVDCPTRWNSCWKMLQRMLDLEGALVKFFAHLKNPAGRKEFKDMEHKLQRPKADEWLAIKCLQVLLGPFSVASDMLGGQTYPTMPLVLPALSGIRVHLERQDLFATIAAETGEEAYVTETVLMMNECRKIMLALYEKRFSEIERSELRWVSYLDPRVGRWMSHLSAADTPRACDELVQAMVVLAQPCPPSEAAERHRTPVQASDDEHRSFMHHHMFGPDEVEPSTTDLSSECEKEFRRYLGAIAKVKSTTNPFTWWQVNSGNFPNVSRLARKWLGTVATSVPSERAFSTSGNILTVKRSSLTPSLVRDLVFLAENWKAIDGLEQNK